MRLLQILFCALIIHSACADDDQISFNSIVDLEGIPSATVGNVNIITGDYCDVACDLVLPGPEPLRLERSYMSSDYGLGSLCYGWNLNHFGSLCFDSFNSKVKPSRPPERRDTHDRSCDEEAFTPRYEKFYASWKGGLGARMFYESEKLEAKDNLMLKVSPEVIRNGITNVGRSEISGRTNQKNTRIEYINDRFYMFNGAGDTHAFVKTNEPNAKGLKISSILLKNGLSTHYEYSPTGKLNAVKVKNLDAFVHSSLRFYRQELDGKLKIEVRSSDNRHIKYKFSEHKQNDKKHCMLLDKVKYSDGYSESYVYEEFFRVGAGKCSRIVETQRPDGRYQQTSYYSVGENAVANQTIKLKKREDPLLGRVSQIKGPIGTDSTPLLINAFTYHFDDQKNDTSSVLDALFHLKVYHHHDGHLKHIRYYKGVGQYSLHADERFFWGQPGAKDAGNLTGHLLQHPSGIYIWCQGYRYDTAGNILEEHFSGNLTGANEIHPYIDDYGFPAANGCETEIKRYAYIDDGRNLLTREFGSRAVKMIGYYENSDLPYAKFLADAESHIKKRQFFFYDENKAMTKEIIDDGSNGATDGDLTGVTRRITRTYTNRKEAPVGLPEEIRECYFDFASGTEKQAQRITRTYTPQGWCLSESVYDNNDAYVYTKSWEYDAAGRITKEIDPLANTIERHYDLNGNKIFEQGYCKEFHHELVYDFCNRLIREELVHSDGHRDVKRYEYNLLSQKIAEWDIRGNATRYEYDDFGNVITISYPSVGKEQRTYDIMGHPKSILDSDGETQFWYTSRGQKYGVRYPDGSSESTRYNLDGTVQFTIAKDGTQTHFEYDYADRPVSKTVLGSNGEHLFITTCTYDAFNMLTETDAAGTTTFYRYDDAGRLVNTKKGVEELRYEYDTMGRQVRTIQMTGADTAIVKILTLDNLDRTIAETVEDEAGNVQSLVETRYDLEGNVAQTIVYGENGPCATVNVYDVYKRLTKTTDPEGNETHIEYDDHFRLADGLIGSSVATIDPRGYKTQIINDVRGRAITQTRRNPFGEEVARTDRTYDAKGRVLTQTEHVYVGGKVERLYTTQWRRDAGGNIVSMLEALSTPEQRETLYSYNPAGQKTKHVKPDGNTLTFAYDSKGRLADFSSDNNSFHYVYSYDALDNPIDIIDVNTGMHTLCQFDKNGRLLSEILANGLTVGYEYDRKGRATRIVMPDQSSVEYHYQGNLLRSVDRYDSNDKKIYAHSYPEYDLRGTLLRSVLPENAGEVAFSHNACGQVTQIDSAHWTETLTYDSVGNIISTQSQKYTYDDHDQLTSDGTHTYTYDSIHNRRSKDGDWYQVNSLNQVSTAGDTSYGYDPNGNRTILSSPGKNITYRYDALDRLIEVQDGNSHYRYMYDASNRRLSKTAYIDNSITHQENYLYLVQNEVGAFTAQNQPIELRILGLSRGAELGAAIAVEKDGKTHYPMHDHQGSVVRLINGDGSLFASLTFTPFGEETTRSRATAWTFSSKRYDPETEFFYFGRRCYDASLGRWVTPDPIGHGDGPNLYAYVHNNPLTHFDEYGLHTVYHWYGFEKFTGGRRSQNYRVEGNAVDANLYHTGFTNGMNTPYKEGLKSVEYLSELGGGLTINWTHNRTKNFICDFGECILGHVFNIATDPVREMRDRWDREFAQMGPDELYHEIAFSQSTIHFKHAIEGCPEDIAKRIVYDAFAPAAFTEPSKCHSVHYYMSDHDPVWLADEKKFRANLQCVTIIKAPANAGWFDHDFRGDTLRPYIKEATRNFKDLVDRNQAKKENDQTINFKSS